MELPCLAVNGIRVDRDVALAYMGLRPNSPLSDSAAEHWQEPSPVTEKALTAPLPGAPPPGTFPGTPEGGSPWQEPHLPLPRASLMSSVIPACCMASLGVAQNNTDIVRTLSSRAADTSNFCWPFLHSVLLKNAPTTVFCLPNSQHKVLIGAPRVPLHIFTRGLEAGQGSL